MLEVKEYSDLPGVKVYTLRLFPDERGFFSEAIRRDWKELLGEDEIVQANVSFSYPGIIRAWHRHLRGQVDYFLVLQGAMKICAYDDRDSPTKRKLVEIVSNSHRLQVVRIPGIYWHGTKTLSSESSLLVYFTTRLYDYQNPDEERRPWNDPTIIDPKTDEPFDWNKLPHSATYGKDSPFKMYFLGRNRYYYIIKNLPTDIMFKFLIGQARIIILTVLSIIKRAILRDIKSIRLSGSY